MLREILDKCKKRIKLSTEEILYLLSQSEESQRKLIFETAREMRDTEYGNKVFLYGFIYFSTICKNNCTFCYYRKENQLPPRYRKCLKEVIDAAKELKESGVHLIDLTTGDDPYYTKNPKRLADIIKAVKGATDLSVMVSPGVLDSDGLKMIMEAGADWYALYQETHNKSLFGLLRKGQSYEDRMIAKIFARNLGMLIEEGLLTGVGDTLEDRAQSFKEMERIKASQLRTMTFVPQDGAPFIGEENHEFNNEMINIAVMRLLFPDALIPASLDVEGLEGLEKRLNAGANVVTSIIPPKKGYAGVANCEQDIDDGHRTVAGIQDTLLKCKLESATTKDYQSWINNSKRNKNKAVIKKKCG